MPSRSVQLHQDVYERHPEIGSVLVAHPPSIMAFAVTDTVFDCRTIPESYILLRETVKVPFGISYRQPKKAASLFSSKTPMLICENDCVIVTGSSLLNAFDRLEVAEFTAKSIIAARNLGDIVHIHDDEIEDINKAFRLE
jgi:L-fuculose-phosphate aldolase